LPCTAPLRRPFEELFLTVSPVSPRLIGRRAFAMRTAVALVDALPRAAAEFPA
jgi:hypothetical protein